MKKDGFLKRVRGAKDLFTEMFQRYRSHEISRQSAAMSYYMFFATFPILIFTSSLLGVLQFETGEVLELAAAVLPAAVVELCREYLAYVTQTANRTLLWFSLVFSVYFPMRAANCLMRGVRKAYGTSNAVGIVRHYFRLFVYALGLGGMLAVALVFSLAGKKLLLLVFQNKQFPLYLIGLWHYLRFVILALFLFAAIGAFYALAQEIPRWGRKVFPGTVLALAAWVLLSLGFSFYVENLSNYSVIYGALGAVIVLLMWLYYSAAALLLGAEFNAMLWERKRKGDFS